MVEQEKNLIDRENSKEETKEEVKEDSTVKAILFMFMGSTSMGMMNVAAKFVSSDTSVSVMQMGTVRGFFMALGCFIHCKCAGIEICKIPDGLGFLVSMRALFGFLSSQMAFIGIFYLPLSIAVVLYYTQPVSASVMNYFFNNEKLSVLQIISILSSLIGVIFISYPQLLVPSLRDDDAAL